MGSLQMYGDHKLIVGGPGPPHPVQAIAGFKSTLVSYGVLFGVYHVNCILCHCSAAFQVFLYRSQRRCSVCTVSNMFSVVSAIRRNQSA